MSNDAVTDEFPFEKEIVEYIENQLNWWSDWFKITELKTIEIDDNWWRGEVSFEWGKHSYEGEWDNPKYNYELFLDRQDLDQEFYDRLNFYYHKDTDSYTEFDSANIFTVIYADLMFKMKTEYERTTLKHND